MARRIMNWACLSSAALMIVTIVLSFATLAVNPWEHRLSLHRSFHVGVWGGFHGDTLGRIVFFNDSETGPYRGSIIGLAGDSRDQLDEAALNWYGIYFRYFHWHTGETLWTLMISLWYPLIFFAVLPAMWGWRRVRSRAYLGELQNDAIPGGSDHQTEPVVTG